MARSAIQRTRPQGAHFTVILRGEKMPGTARMESAPGAALVGSFTIHLNKTVSTRVKVAWLVVN